MTALRSLRAVATSSLFLVAFVTGCSAADTTAGSGSSSSGTAGGSGAEQSGAAQGSATPGKTSDGTNAGGAATPSTPDEKSGPVEGTTEIKAGSSVTLASTAGGSGNPQRDYYVLVPAGKSALKLTLSGGTCEGECVGDDVHLFLRAGDVADAFDPDSKTSKYTYTPGGGGTFKHEPATAGYWYVSVIDDANTLGYTGVKLSVSFQ